MKKCLAVFILMCLILSACKSKDPITTPQSWFYPLPGPTDPIIPDDDDDDDDSDDDDDDDSDDDD